MSVIHQPNGSAQVLALGDPRKFLMPDGNVDHVAWEKHLGLVAIDFPEPLKLSWAHDQVARAIRVHPISAEAWRRAFAMVHGSGLWPLLHDFGGGFNVRFQRGSDSKISTHAWGLAGDFDVKRNPLGARPQMDMEIVRIFQAVGFTWGGEWMRPDGQHFQWAKGY